MYGWSGDLAGTSSPISLTMDGDKVVTATFTEIPTYTLTVVISPTAGGSVTLTPPGVTYIEPLIYDESTVVTLTGCRRATLWKLTGAISWRQLCSIAVFRAKLPFL